MISPDYKIEIINGIKEGLEKIKSLEELKDFFHKYLGKRGSIKLLLKNISDLPYEKKKKPRFFSARDPGSCFRVI